jgi:hypothetical protein
MSKNAKIAAGGVAAGLILLIWLPWWACGGRGAACAASTARSWAADR